MDLLFNHFTLKTTFSSGINELEKGILLQFSSQNHPRNQKECNQAQKLQHKMKLNLDMAKKRLDFHLNLENKKSQSVLKHLSLPRNAKPPSELSGPSKSRASRKEERRSCYGGPYTPQPARKTHKRCSSSAETHSLSRNRRNSISGLSSSKKQADNSKFMKVNTSRQLGILMKCPLFPPPDRDERDDRGGRPVQLWRHRRAGLGQTGSAGDSHPALSQVGIIFQYLAKVTDSCCLLSAN